ncbi:hypothetical protein [Luteolibacter soli]|uniref:Uncharacterized protein n=1 Tax=Luteolibacter soli TaxID=3135280 RepID=A0ABU9ART3_9BACT
MKPLSIFLTSVYLAGAAQAANIAIKNDTGAAQRVVIYQDGKVAGYVDRLKAGKTLLVKVDDAGGKPLLSLKIAGKDEFLFLPLKTNSYKLSWLRNLFW